LSHLACLGRHTLSAWVSTSGRQFEDWSADYRLFERDRIDEQQLFKVARCEVESHLGKDEPLIVALDDSVIPKTGTQIAGVGWRRHPLSPPFRPNFIRGQRVLQLSAALPCAPGQARMIPIDFLMAPPAPKPPRQPSPQELKHYQEQARQRSLNHYALDRLAELRRATPRPIRLLFDGRFTNRTLLKNLPQNVTAIGRIRKDAKLYAPPLPTPEQLRQEETIPWQSCPVYAADQWHDFDFKTIGPLRWRTAGPLNLRLVVIRPLHYRLTKMGRLLYRQPAFLICTDPHLPVQKIIQAYVWRWDIEVNFRDEKTLLGVGQPHVRTKLAAQKVPAASVAAYSLLLLAAARAFGPNGRPDSLPPPKWQQPKQPPRASTAKLINQLRFELWGHAISASLIFSGFSSSLNPFHMPQKLPTNPAPAILYASQ
jgi:hypothetical protein